MGKAARRLRRIVDKEWIRVGWLGMPTLRHYLIAFTPMAILLIPSALMERWSYDASVAIMLVGLLITFAMLFWMRFRQMTGLGYFNSVRSDRVAKRRRLRRLQSSEWASTDLDTNAR